ncbi:MAG: hypothetical protein SH847_19550 [Roseiflexaceae bacterium]|nr:hypothetical protein [Roseiflexaceae bacterium]
MSAAELNALAAAVFGTGSHPLATWYAERLAAIPPLRAFTTAYTSKIRKKARSATTIDPLRDLYCELAVAAALTADRRSSVIYEPMAAAGQRGPDFLLRYKGHTTIYIEVSRLRPAQSPERVPAERLAAMLCGKLEQLASGAANLLVLVSDDGPFGDETIRATIQGLRLRADAKDDAYFAFRGLASASMLHQTLPRLSGILAVAPAVHNETLFLYAQARHALPADLVRAVRTWNLSSSIGPLM